MTGNLILLNCTYKRFLQDSPDLQVQALLSQSHVQSDPGILTTRIFDFTMN